MLKTVPFRCLVLALILVSDGAFSHAQGQERNLEGKGLREDMYGDPLPRWPLHRLGSVRFRQRDTLTCVSFSPNGKMVATGGQENTIYLWEFPSGKRLARWRAHKSIITSLAFCPDSKAIVSAGDGVCVWDVSSLVKTRDFAEEGEWFTSLAVSPDG